MEERQDGDCVEVVVPVPVPGLVRVVEVGEFVDLVFFVVSVSAIVDFKFAAAATFLSRAVVL